MKYLRCSFNLLPGLGKYACLLAIGNLVEIGDDHTFDLSLNMWASEICQDAGIFN
jgi:hypothetical protein